MTILISDKIDWNARSIIRDRKDYFITIKGQYIGKENNYTCIHAEKQSFEMHKAKTDRTEVEINNSTIIVGYLNTPLNS